jgi:hypothetical protein
MASEFEKSLGNSRLNGELRTDPPPLSILPNQRIWNRIQITDEKGKHPLFWWTLQTMTNLKRFSRGRNKLSEVVTQFMEGADRDGLTVLKDFADDFYGAWYLASSELVMSIGFDETLEIFRLLRVPFFVTWPGSSLDYFSEEGKLPEAVTVFRGESQQLVKAGISSGLSWSLDRTVAEYYAHRSQDGILHKGTVSFDNVLLFQTEEMEVIVNPGSVVLFEPRES